MNKRSLIITALAKSVVGLLLVMALLFVSAGTLRYWQGWLFIAVLFVPMTLMGLVLLYRNPSLLRKRLEAREKESGQRRGVAVSAALFVAMFVTAGLNYRMSWWVLPDAVAISAAVVFLLGYLLYAEVMRENIWLSRTVEVQEGQQVVDTGLYGIVRHPMYSSTLILFLTAPVILASLWSLVVMLLYIPLLVKRIRDEERVLSQGLEGYKEYCRRVRFRLIPYVW